MGFLWRFALGVLALAAMGEIALRILPVSSATHSGYYVAPSILTYPPGHRFTMSTGWDLKNAQYLQANNYGFIADHDFVRDSGAVALIGDSFVEANMLPASDRLGAQLEARLRGQNVYALGGPGSSLLDYAERARFAAEKFGVRTFVFVLERGDIRQSLCGSGNVHGPCLAPTTLESRVERQPEPGLAKRVFRESALAQYVFSQLKFDPARFLKGVARSGGEKDAGRDMGARPPSAIDERAAKAVLETFFSRLPRSEGGRLVMVVDVDREHLLSASVADAYPELTLLGPAALSAGVQLVDIQQPFHRFVARSGLKLEVGPYDHHWNRAATALVADSLASALLPGGGPK